jgi:hypothetical protein
MPTPKNANRIHTFRLPDPLERQLKAVAARDLDTMSGTLRRLLLRAIRQEEREQREIPTRRTRQLSR